MPQARSVIAIELSAPEGWTDMVGRLERGKDTVQVLTDSAAEHIGQIATIITRAVSEITREIGDWVSDGFEMRDAADRAAQAHDAE